MNGDPGRQLEGLTPEEKRELLRSLLKNRNRPRSRYPLSHHQAAMWFLDRMAPGSVSYNTALAMRAEPPLKLEPLRRSFEQLVERHAALRTVFESVDGVPVQSVREHAPVDLKIVAIENEDRLLDAVVAEYRLPFDLEKNVLRTALFRGPGYDVLLVVIHHIVFDASSAVVFYRELRALYDAACGIPAGALPPLPATYYDFVQWQAEMIESAEGHAAWEYWSQRLSGELPVLNLPFAKPVPSGLSSEAETIPLRIEGVAYTRLKDLVREQRTTLFSVLAAAYTVLLHRLSGHTDLIVGMPVSGRTRPEWERLMGDFINMLPLRVSFPGDFRFAEHLKAVSTETRNALAHQDFPFTLMAERLRVPRFYGTSPIFQTMINVHVARQGSELSRLFDSGNPLPFGSSQLRHYPMPQQEGQFDISLETMDTGAGLVGGLRYMPGKFDKRDAEHMVEQFASVLRQVGAQPDLCVSGLRVEAPAADECPSEGEHFVF